MKIVVVNRNYFVTGGPEKYMFTVMENFQRHEFIPFCCAFKQNRETPYSTYFVTPPGGEGNIYFQEFRMSFFQKISYAVFCLKKIKEEEYVHDPFNLHFTFQAR